MKNQDLDNFFKSKSNSFDEMPSDDLWKKIENNLLQEPKPKSNFKKPFFTMILPIITLFSVATLILNSNEDSKIIDKTTLSKDSVKNKNSVIVLDTNAQSKSSLPVLSPIVKETKSTAMLKDSVLITKQDLKTNDTQEKYLPNDTVKTIQLVVTRSNVSEKNAIDFDKKAIQDKTNIIFLKEEKPKTIEQRNVISPEFSNFQEKIYSINEVAVKPEFPNGINQLYELIRKKYKTPKDCTGGRITMTFVIEKDGSLTDIKTVKDIGFGAGDEAVRVLKECPKWIPGKHDGKTVRVQYTLPISIEAEEGLDNKLILDNDNLIWSMAGVNVKPEFIGGTKKLYAFIEQNIKIPKNYSGGKFYISFIVEKEGSLSNFEIGDGGAGIGEEVIRVLKECPKWEPGEQNGKKVRVRYSLMVTVNAKVGLVEEIIVDTTVHSMAGIEQKPEYIGGMEKLYAFIEKNYKIPKDCPDGKVFLTFIVEKDGSLSDIKTVRDIGFGSGEEAVRVLKECPNWIPGEQNGRKVRVLLNLTVTVKKADNK